MGPLIRVEEHLNAQGDLKVTANQVHLLALSPDGSKSTTETLLRLVVLHNHQISIQLRICGMRTNGGSWQLGPVPTSLRASESAIQGMVSNLSNHLRTTHRVHAKKSPCSIKVKRWFSIVLKEWS
ncbi:hypothetical protein TNCV_3970511 [Trichonephila clavipes]|nr:hypothetical protein TNCV_3970511 [Trichonephila clavipes]